MGKPSAPPAPDYVGAAKAQGVANLDSALATNYLNQADQITPYGTMKYTYGDKGTPTTTYDPLTGESKTSYSGGDGFTLSDGSFIPRVTATTELAPDQQKLLDQTNQQKIALNDIALKGINYVDTASSNPIDQNKLPSLKTGLSVNGGDLAGIRDKVTDAYMARLQPYMDKQRDTMAARLANQGITHGSEAWNWDQDVLNRGQNDQRLAALIAGDNASQQLFQQGLASDQFGNQARQQAIQEADYFKNQPLNMFNALRTGNQVSMPQFGNVTGGSQVGAAPIYQATADQYSAALQAYQTQMAGYSGMLGGLATLGGGAMIGFGK